MENQKVAVVTGGATGIGKEITGKLAEDGFFVIVADLNAAETKKIAEDLTDMGYLAEAMPMDISAPGAVRTAFLRIEDQFGRCDVLVNNAGIAKTYPFLAYPLENWRLTMDVNLTGPLLMAQKAAELMIRHRWGRIINMASAAGVRAGVGRTAYGTSKAALIGLTRQMAIELAPFGITANSLAPGPIETPLVAQLHSAETRETYTRMVPMHRYGTPMEVASVVSFLASDSASYVTGTMIPVDGGFIAAGLLDI